MLLIVVAARVSVEASSTFSWDRYLGSKGKDVGVNKFYVTSPARILYKPFGLTIANVATFLYYFRLIFMLLLDGMPY